ncbi:MAG TPA: hypothetical protein VMT20_15415 [Terriglobia bacterium]|nr:hypothetical protein [Terriglobia bacterium]
MPYHTEQELKQKAEARSAEQTAEVLQALQAVEAAISHLNSLVDQLPESVVVENKLALRYFLGRAGQDKRQGLSSFGVSVGGKPVNVPATSQVDREEYRQLLRGKGFSEDEVLKRFPLLPHEKEAPKAHKTDEEKFKEAFYRAQAKASGLPVEKIADHWRFRELADDAWKLAQEPF